MTREEFIQERIAEKGETREQAERAADSLMRFQTMISKTPEEINSMCDSGMFNSIIEGYILIALDELNLLKKCSHEDFRLIHHIFDDYSAATARKVFETHIVG